MRFITWVFIFSISFYGSLKGFSTNRIKDEKVLEIKNETGGETQLLQLMAENRELKSAKKTISIIKPYFLFSLLNSSTQ
jgi:hypothetical protein